MFQLSGVHCKVLGFRAYKVLLFCQVLLFGLHDLQGLGFRAYKVYGLGFSGLGKGF